MRIKSYSKINLSLRILNKLKNGMHNIETNSVLINLFDEIEIKKNKKDVIIFKGNFRNNINLKNNSISHTINVLRSKNIIKNYYKITVKKNIPVYAGLGGGTGNSVSILKHFLKNKVNKNLIKSLEKKIGSDFRLFLNKSVFQKNLKIIHKTKNNIKLPFLVVFPNINCKTKKIYKLVKSYSPPSHIYLKKLNEKIFIKNIKKDRNDLQKIGEKKYSKIYQLLKFLEENRGCIFSRMTGSGSACYGVFKTKKTAKFAIDNLKRKYPKYWCAITKTI